MTQHHLGQGDISRARLESQKAVFAEPSRREARHTLASLALQSARPSAARASLAGSEDDITALRDSVGLQAVAEALNAGTNLERSRTAGKLAQKAVMLAPWNRRNWEVFAYVRSQAAL